MRRQSCLWRSPKATWLRSPALVVVWILTVATASSHADSQATAAATSASVGITITNRDEVILAGAMPINVSGAATFATDPAVKLAIIDSISALTGAPSTFITVPAINFIEAGRQPGSVAISPFASRSLSSSGPVLVTYIVTMPGHRPDVGAVLETLQASSAGAIAALIDAEIGEAIGHDKYRVSVLKMDTMVLRSQGSQAGNGGQAGDASIASVLTVSLLAVLGFLAVLASYACSVFLHRRSNHKKHASKETASATSSHEGKGKLPAIPAPEMESAASSLEALKRILKMHKDAAIMPVILDTDALERDIEQWLAGTLRCCARDGPSEKELPECGIAQELDDRHDGEAVDGAILMEQDAKEDLKTSLTRRKPWSVSDTA